MDDQYLFADSVAQKLNREVGAFSSGIVPGARVKSATGVARGEELFFRPELHRPWRSSSAQRHAETLVLKEHEIEVLTRKCTELQSHLAVANRELQKHQHTSTTTLEKTTREKDDQISNLKSEIEKLKKKLDEKEISSQQQLRALVGKHDQEVTQLHGKVKTSHDGTVELSSIYSKQINEVKVAAAREVELIQQLSQARVAELSNELAAANEMIHRLNDKSTGALGDLKNEMRRSEDRCLDQLREQDRRVEALRAQMQMERQQVELQRDKALGDLNFAEEKIKVLTFDLMETETRFKDWNARLLSDLDQLYNYYSMLLKESAENSEGGSAVTSTESTQVAHKVAEVYVPPRISSDHSAKSVMDRISERMRQLTWMKQQHNNQTQSMVRKMRQVESSASASQENFQRQSLDNDAHLSRLISETHEAKDKQGRLEKAFSELKTSFSDIESRMFSTITRLQFFSVDLAESLAHPIASVLAPRGTVTFLVTRVHGAGGLWEFDPVMMRTSLMLLNAVLRAKAAQYGGYECGTDGDSFVLAFPEPTLAANCAAESQLWLMEQTWPAALLSHVDGCEQFVTLENGDRTLIFRGLRVAMAIHQGEVEAGPTSVPTGIGSQRVNYHGRPFIQALHLASISSGGQIVVSTSTWGACNASELSCRVAVTDLGDHKIYLPQRERSATNQQAAAGQSLLTANEVYATSEFISITQILPHELKARKFPEDAAIAYQKHSFGGQGATISPHLAHFRRVAIQHEMDTMRSRYDAVAKACEVLNDEVKAVNATVEALQCKLRDAQVHGKVYSQADLIAQAAALDRLIGRADSIRSDLTTALSSQKELAQAMKNIEDLLIVHTKISISEDDFKRRIEIIHDRCNEKIFEATSQSEQRMENLKASLMRVEALNADLRQQLQNGPTRNEELAKERKAAREHIEKLEQRIRLLQGTSTGLNVSSSTHHRRPSSAQQPSADGRPPLPSPANGQMGSGVLPTPTLSVSSQQKNVVAKTHRPATKS